MMLFTGPTLLSLLQLWAGWRQAGDDDSDLFTTNFTPSAQLDHATVTGVRNGSIEYFLGVPYAQPPVGDLRYRLPQIIESYDGLVDATTYGHPCLSQPLDLVDTFPPEIVPGLQPFFEVMGLMENVTESEDCLHLNIVRPANVKPDSRLPVVFWIHGGAFVQGSNAITLYNGTRFVERSVELGQPVIYVALNYRLQVLGFLGGAEMKNAGLGNLGLQDQRTALRWVNKFISSFGGDPSKVTIWGESAGSMSVFLHLYANGGVTEGLFRAGIMSSGFAVSTRDITDVQEAYEFVAKEVGCSGTDDTLSCLRTVPAEALVAAASSAPGGIISYFPHSDGSLVGMPPMHLPSDGEIADVPFLTGDVKDEGTYSSFMNLNVTTEEELRSFLSTWFPGSSPTDLRRLLKLYPSDPAAGSPFDTGNENVFSPQFKRIAALQGDFLFHGPRRLLLDAVSAKRTAYNYLSARGNFPGLGHFHATDLLNSLGGGDMSDYFIRFANHLDPNAEKDVQWPPYNSSARSTLQFNEGSVPVNVTVDDQRAAGIKELISLALRFPF